MCNLLSITFFNIYWLIQNSLSSVSFGELYFSEICLFHSKGHIYFHKHFIIYYFNFCMLGARVMTFSVLFLAMIICVFVYQFFYLFIEPPFDFLNFLNIHTRECVWVCWIPTFVKCSNDFCFYPHYFLFYFPYAWFGFAATWDGSLNHSLSTSLQICIKDYKLCLWALSFCIENCYWFIFISQQ